MVKADARVDDSRGGFLAFEADYDLYNIMVDFV